MGIGQNIFTWVLLNVYKLLVIVLGTGFYKLFDMDLWDWFLEYNHLITIAFVILIIITNYGGGLPGLTRKIFSR